MLLVCVVTSVGGAVVCRAGDSATVNVTVKESGHPDRLIAACRTRIVYEDGGVKELEISDNSGHVFIPKSSLVKALFVIICRDGYYCTAIDVKEFRLSGFDEFQVYLANFATW